MHDTTSVSKVQRCESLWPVKAPTTLLCRAGRNKAIGQDPKISGGRKCWNLGVILSSRQLCHSGWSIGMALSESTSFLAPKYSRTSLYIPRHLFHLEAIK